MFRDGVGQGWSKFGQQPKQVLHSLWVAVHSLQIILIKAFLSERDLLLVVRVAFLDGTFLGLILPTHHLAYASTLCQPRPKVCWTATQIVVALVTGQVQG